MRSFICEICRTEYPVSLHHHHHKVPKALGGSDAPSNMADLCSADHQSLHTIAHMIVNQKRRHEIEPTLASLYPGDIATQKKLLGFANLAAREMALKKELKKNPTDETRVVVEIPQLYLQLLRLMGFDRPHQDGKPTGVSTLIRNGIADMLVKSFPLKAKEVNFLRRKKAKGPE